jgi:DNA-binding beta-propeller fold protein YncE
MFNVRISLGMLVAGVLFFVSITFAGTPASTANYKIIDSIKGPDFLWDYVSVDTKARRLYVARIGGVIGVDLGSGAVTPTLLASEMVHGVIPVGDAGLAVATNGLANSATLFHGDTGAIVATIPVGMHPDAVAYEPVTKMAVTFNAASHDATIIDLQSHSPIATVALGGKPEFPAADGGGLVYDNIEDKNEIAVIDIAARKVIRRIPLAGCEGPTGLAYDAATGLLISVCGNGVAKFVDAKTGKEAASVAVGEGPDAVILDAERRLAFVPSGASGTLSVITLKDVKTIELVQSLKTLKGVRTGAVDPLTGRLYLPSAEYLKPSSPGQRPAVVPGSFKILVVSPE